MPFISRDIKTDCFKGIYFFPKCLRNGWMGCFNRIWSYAVIFHAFVSACRTKYRTVRICCSSSEGKSLSKRCNCHRPSAYASREVISGNKGSGLKSRRTQVPSQFVVQKKEDSSPILTEMWRDIKSRSSSNRLRIEDLSNEIILTNFAHTPTLFSNFHHSLQANALDTSSRLWTPIPFSRTGKEMRRQDLQILLWEATWRLPEKLGKYGFNFVHDTKRCSKRCENVNRDGLQHMPN